MEMVGARRSATFKPGLLRVRRGVSDGADGAALPGVVLPASAFPIQHVVRVRGARGALSADRVPIWPQCRRRVSSPS